MVSKIANRRKLVSSRHRLRAGAEGELSEKDFPVQNVSKDQSNDGSSTMKQSDRLRAAAIEALKTLKEYGASSPFVINSEMTKDKDGVDQINKMEDRFYKRCEASKDLVLGMQKNLMAEREANLQKLLEAEKKLQEQKRSAVKSQAALNFLTKKNDRFNELGSQLDTLKSEISLMVDKANELNTTCTTELDQTVNEDVRKSITKELDSVTEQDEAITKRLTKLLDDIASPVEAQGNTAVKPADDSSSEGETRPDTSYSNEGVGRRENTKEGGRYRRSRNNNRRKRRSFHLKRRGGGCNGHNDVDSCDDDDDCLWNQYSNSCIANPYR
jgi:hypothetical protein